LQFSSRHRIKTGSSSDRVFASNCRRSGQRVVTATGPDGPYAKFFIKIVSSFEKKYLRLHAHKKQNNARGILTLPLLHVRAFDSVTVRIQMKESREPLDANELARLRALVSEYETKLTDAASRVARVRHEINNPLAALLGQAQLLLREELSDKSRKRAETIESQAKRIEDIVGELREIQIPVAASHRRAK
jgi:signal transduction histidine kinase